MRMKEEGLATEPPQQLQQPPQPVESASAEDGLVDVSFDDSLDEEHSQAGGSDDEAADNGGAAAAPAEGRAASS